MTRKLLIYSDKKFLPLNSGWSEILYPFWGKLPELSEMLGYERFESYTKDGKHYFELIDDIKSCDIAVLPNDWKRYVRTNTEGLAKDFVKIAESWEKKVLCSYFADDDNEIPLKNAIILRPSLNKSSKKNTELAMPAWVMDYYSYQKTEMPIRKWEPKPVVSFCGYAKAGIRKILINELHRFQGKPYSPGYHGLKLRWKILNIIKHSKRINSNIRIKSEYFGGILNKNKYQYYSTIQKVREQYFENVVNSDYVLCIRGAGNFSFRFYEALACGRISVFVNTDCSLPFDELFIDYKKHCVWIEEEDFDSLEERILQFHQSLSADEFINIQHKNRELWINYLTPVGYFKHLTYALSNILKIQ